MTWPVSMDHFVAGLSDRDENGDKSTIIPRNKRVLVH